MNQMFKTLFLVVCFILINRECFCQENTKDSLLIRQMLSRIFYLQENHEKDFPKGLIPSYREYYHRKGVLKNDDNIFFTGLVVFTLRYLYPDLDKRSQNICNAVFEHAALVYTRYQNRKGRPTYNFWQTDKPEIFPNSGWLNLFNKSQALPDDMDVTSIIMLAANETDSTVVHVHGLMQEYTNSNRKRIKSSLPDYTYIKAYSTWFGKNMPVDFDFGVLTNILYLVNKYQLPYTSADSASLEFLCKVVEKRHYMKAAAIMSSSYNRTPVLLYHLSRLMAETKIPALEKWKPQLIKDAKSTYKHSNNLLDKIILSTSLMRWGVELPDDTLTIKTSLETFTEKNDFVFFIANITSMFPRPFNTWLGKTGIGKFYYYCPAYNYALLLENMIVRKRMKG
jgi:hypothetical protein